MRKLAPMLCAAALTLSLVMPASAYYASNEDGANEPGGPITSVSVTTEPVAEPTLPTLGGLTPDGNLASSTTSSAARTIPVRRSETARCSSSRSRARTATHSTW